jgi:hypothetical protein
MLFFRFLALCFTFLATPLDSYAESMSGDMSNTIVAKGEIIDRVIYKESSSIRSKRTTFVYSVKYKNRIYFCVVDITGTYCSGSDKM